MTERAFTHRRLGGKNIPKQRSRLRNRERRAGFGLIVGARMPGMSDLELQAELKAEHSEIPITWSRKSLPADSTPLGSASQIEDRKSAEEIPFEAQLQATLNVIPACAFYARPTGALTFANERTADYLGVPKDHPLRSGNPTGAAWDSHLHFVHPDEQEEARKVWSTCLRTGRAGEFSFRVRDGKGEYRWFLSRTEPLRASDGSLLYWVGVNLDIEDRKRAEEELRRSEAYLSEAQRLSHTGSFGCKFSSGEMFWSEETFGIFGYNRATTPAVEAILHRVHPEDKARVQEHMHRAANEGKGCDLEYRLLMPDDSVKHVHVVAYAAKGEPGRFEFVGAVTDVTEQRCARAELERALEEIKRLKDRLQDENIALREEIIKASMFEEIVGHSPPLQQVLVRVAKVAPTDSTVLITGETGTGKELIARAIHKASKRSNRAFVSVNCAAIPPSLIPSELFGHEKGAFTDATGRRLGRFELAEGGAIFLDEVGDLPRETQVALLRVLQEREFKRVGGNRSIRADVRVIVATNRDLEAAIAEGTFRSDLFYRLNVFPIEIPPLRQRREDIRMLVQYFIDRYATELGKNIRNVSKETLDLFQSYAWPGNIRELRNVIERSIIVCETETFSVDESWLSRQPLPAQPTGKVELRQRLADQEREAIQAALTESRGRVFGPTGAAARLGIARSTLESKIRTLKIDKNRFKIQIDP
jgi:transcriptional regulator with GAF, ATPase, and Fis domain